MLKYVNGISRIFERDVVRMNWIQDERVLWLDPLDAFLAISLLKEEQTGEICEIGIYKGGWLLTLLRNLPNWKAIGVDPYPNLSEIRASFLNFVKINGLVDRVDLFENYDSIWGKEFKMIHIDGEHSESAVLSDLAWAERNISRQGVIIVDDIWHPLFPGIASAVMKVVHSSSFVPFLITRNKIYLTFEENYQTVFELAKKSLVEAGIGFSTGSRKGKDLLGTPAAFDQSNAIKGYEQIVVPKHNPDFICSSLGISTSRKAKGSIAKTIMKQLVPPAIWSIARSFAARFHSALR